jgi:NADH-quinone oxidoreductase subunit A
LAYFRVVRQKAKAMFEAHFPLLLTFFLASGLGATLLLLSSFLGPRRPSAVKSEAFECGNPSSGPALDRFNVKFYLVAILFLVFDIEAVFIYPWALVFHDATLGKSVVTPLFALMEMVIFVGIIVVGLTYAWRKGALEWNGRDETAHHEIGHDKIGHDQHSLPSQAHGGHV